MAFRRQQRPSEPRSATGGNAAAPASSHGGLGSPHQLTNLQSTASGAPAQRVEETAQTQSLSTSAQSTPRSSGAALPDRLQANIEAMSGHSLTGVRVFRQSSEPAQLKAHAFTRGTDIHLAPGQDQHLAHEAWHVVQQLDGRVQADSSVAGVAINTSPALENEADKMGQRALSGSVEATAPDVVHSTEESPVVQRREAPDTRQQSSLLPAPPQRLESEVVQLVRGAHFEAPFLSGYDPVDELTEGGDVDQAHIHDLLYGLTDYRGATTRRLEDRVSQGTGDAARGRAATSMRTIDEYNAAVGITGNTINGRIAAVGVYEVRAALTDPGSWTTHLRSSTASYPGANAAPTPAERWIKMLVDNRQNIGLYDLGSSVRPVVGTGLFGRPTYGEEEGISRIKDKGRFEKNGGDSETITPKDINEMLSFGEDIDAATAHWAALPPAKQTALSEWIQNAFWRRTSKLGIDFATSPDGLNAEVHFNLAGGEQTSPGQWQAVGWGVLNDIAADMGKRKITESEWRHVKKIVKANPDLASKITAYSEA